MTWPSPLELVASFLSAVGVWLTARQLVLSWPVGIVGLLLSAWVYWETRLYGQTALQFVFIAISVYGWRHWVRGGDRDGREPGDTAHGSLRVTRMPARWWPAVVLATAAGALGIGWFLATQTDGAIPWLDASLLAVSLAAQWMQSRKYVDCWAVWIAVDVIYVPTFISQGLLTFAVLYAFFLVLAADGWRAWRRDMRNARPVAV